MREEFWKGKKVFITGHTGFKGSWLTLWLHSLGAEVTGYSFDVPTTPSLYEKSTIGKYIHSCVADVRNLDSLKSALKDSEAEIVFHLAAQSLVRESYKNPIDTYSTNVMGTVNVLEAVRLQANVKSVVIVTSDKCYENKEWLWGYRENEAMGGHDPYSNSKGCAELVTSAYRNSFFSESGAALVASARAGNVIGGGDWAIDRLVPDIVKSFGAGEVVKIRSPESIRPWQHVLEPINGYMMLAEKLYEGKAEYAQGWNFGPVDSDVQSVSWIVNRMSLLWGEGASWELDENVIKLHEASLLALDHSFARYKLKWQPLLGLDMALEWVVDWYKSFNASQDMNKKTLDQIKMYQELGVR